MKRFKYFFRAILAVLLINLTTEMIAQDFQGHDAEKSSAQTTDAPQGTSNPETRLSVQALAWLDSVDISLLTCGPGKEVWSYYGHTALRIEDKAHGNDLAVNWGMFSFSQDYFILRFVFGLTDYQIGIFPMARFIDEYSEEGRWVKQQRLALTREEKLKILTAIEENNKEENRTYRYNFFFDNCTMRTRNIIINNLKANDTDFKNTDANSTYRNETHRWNENHRWARFGNDLLLGYKSDLSINKREWEFLPVNLLKDFEVEARKDTSLQQDPQMDIHLQRPRYIKLVDSSFYVIPPQPEVVESEGITPRMVAIALALLIILASVAEVTKKKNFWWMDTLLLILTGLPGLVLLAMVFSEHPTVQVNFQMLILNPLNLVFVYQVTQRLRKGKMHWYYNVWGTLLVISLLMQIWQDFAEGMVILALSLLIRYLLKSIQETIKH